MGTNYYLECKPCEKCGAPTGNPVWGGSARLHIGKSSAGWYFSGRAHPEFGITSLADWFRIFENTEDYVIRNEYGDVIKPLDMVGIFLHRGDPTKPKGSHGTMPCGRPHVGGAAEGLYGLLHSLKPHPSYRELFFAIGDGPYDMMEANQEPGEGW